MIIIFINSYYQNHLLVIINYNTSIINHNLLYVIYRYQTKATATYPYQNHPDKLLSYRATQGYLSLV